MRVVPIDGLTHNVTSLNRAAQFEQSRRDGAKEYEFSPHRDTNSMPSQKNPPSDASDFPSSTHIEWRSDRSDDKSTLTAPPPEMDR